MSRSAGTLRSVCAELPELDVAVPRVAGADDRPFQHGKRSEQAGGTVAFVVVGHRAATSLLHRQTRLRAVEGLHLGLLVHAEHDSFVRRIEVDAHYVGELLYEPFVLGERLTRWG